MRLDKVWPWLYRRFTLPQAMRRICAMSGFRCADGLPHCPGLLQHTNSTGAAAAPTEAAAPGKQQHPKNCKEHHMRILEQASASAAVRIGLVAASTAALALAAAAGPAAAAAPAFGYAPAPAIGAPLASSSGWGGYAATNGKFTSIVGTWVEPKVTCTSDNNLFAPWVGIDGYGSQTVEQTGAQVSCSSGSPVYSAWYEMYPKAPVYLSKTKYPVAANDSLTGSVTAAGGGEYKITLKDTTKGWSYSTTQKLSAQDVSAEAIIESPTASYPNFTACKFSGITVNGKTFSSFKPTGLDVGKYKPTTLSGGAFSMEP
jgi:hypothetical protein